jgi:hypothetical protein
VAADVARVVTAVAAAIAVATNRDYQSAINTSRSAKAGLLFLDIILLPDRSFVTISISRRISRNSQL